MPLLPAQTATQANHQRYAPRTVPGDSAPAWVTRGTNFVVVVSRVSPGDTLVRDNPDEYVLVVPPDAPNLWVQVQAGAESVRAGADSLTIVPPGHSTLRIEGSGLVARIFSSDATDLLALADNRDTYAQPNPDAPIAIVLHPHPQYGGTMNNRVVYNLHYAFHRMGFTVMRFNFRGVGRSQGEFDQGIGELSDAASALDYLQAMNPNSKHCWVAGFSFGAWIGMQLLMRRPEITGFISVAPPANLYDFSFLAPCPSSGLIINGTADRVAPPKDTAALVAKLREQKGITITHDEIEGADHFFRDDEVHMKPMIDTVQTYVRRRLTETTR